MQPVPDRGPWRASKGPSGQVFLASDDFAHDVQLAVSGDFQSPAHLLAYGQALARVLTAGCARAHATAALEDPAGLLTALCAAAGPQSVLLQQAADEIARLRVALAEADHLLAQHPVRQHQRNKVQAAQVPSAFAQALDRALTWQRRKAPSFRSGI